MSVLSVTDLGAAVDAYTRTMGMEVVMNHGWIAILASPEHPNAQLGLITKDRTGPVNMDASIEVDDVDAALDRVREAGFPIEYGPADEPWGVRRFYVRDPFGKLVNILAHAERNA